MPPRRRIGSKPAPHGNRHPEGDLAVHRTAARLLVTVFALLPATLAAGGSAVTPVGSLAWRDAGIPGVAIAVVEGDPARGASHFYLRYAAGLVTPLHHHSPDHYVTTVAGQLVLVVAGEEHRLPPGSYFALTGGAPHVARCEGSEACVMFLDARGAWDVVPEPPAKP